MSTVALALNRCRAGTGQLSILAFSQLSCQRRALSSTRALFAGHNKWSKIKDRKAANDAQKSVLYTKYNHEIRTAISQGGADASKNNQLAQVLKRAKEAGVPKENIEKSVKRYSESSSGDSGSTVIYEAMVGDQPMLIECKTDNVNRTLHFVRETITQAGGRMAAVKYHFARGGRINVAFPPEKEADLMSKLVELPLVDIVQSPSSKGDLEKMVFSLLTTVEQHDEATDSLYQIIEEEGDSVVLESSICGWVPQTPEEVDEQTARVIQEAQRKLMSHEDVVEVVTTADVD